MKTILRTKRPQNKYIAFSLFLLIAVFGLFIGGVKPPTGGDVTQTSIGGNGSVVVPAPTPFVSNSTIEIGGQHVPRDTSPLSYQAEIGGQRVPGDANPIGKNSVSAGFAIGGQGATSPETRAFYPLCKSEDISGQAVPQDTRAIHQLSNANIGGQGVEPKNFLIRHGHIQSTVVQAKITDRIGWNSVPKNEIGGGQSPPPHAFSRATTIVDIGGNQGAPQTPGLPYLFSESTEIGGNGVPMPTLPIIGFSLTEKQEIGGNPSTPQPTLPFSKVSARMVADSNPNQRPFCIRKYSMFDFNLDFESMDLEDIGGGQTVPMENDDISGTQGAPRG